MPTCSLCHLTRGVVRDNDYWTMAVNENQATLGRVFFALKRHETDVTSLTADECESLWRFLREAKEALTALFAPDHFNYLFHMNLDPHCHMHIYPRYAAPREFAGQTFADSRFGNHYDPDEAHPLDEATRDALVMALRHELTQPTRTLELMIASLRGTLAHVGATFLILDVGGVGYKVSVPVTTLNALPPQGETAFLYVHTHIRAEEISLFGFAQPGDQQVFELLLSVTGIGPKVALSILSAMDADSLARAVAAEDTKTLVRIPGLGLKTAQRLVLELRDKLAAMVFERKVDAIQAKSQKPPAEDIFNDVVEGLIGLGYNRNDARRAADKAIKEIADKTSMAAALKAALNILTGADNKK